MFTSLFPAFIQWPFWSFCWPESSPHDLFERGFVQKGLWKWISCLHKYCSLHYSELPIWKESEIQGLGILCAIDLLKHLEEEAEALEGGRMWVLYEDGGYVSSLMFWNSSQVCSESFGNRWVCGRVGGERWLRQSWNDRLVEASLTQESKPSIWAGYFNRLKFSYTVFSKFLWSRSASKTLVHHSSTSFLLQERNVTTMQENFAFLIFSSASAALVPLSYSSNPRISRGPCTWRPHQLLTLVSFFQRRRGRWVAMEP